MNGISFRRFRVAAVAMFAASAVAFSLSAMAQETSIGKLEGYDLTFPSMGSTITLSAYSDSQAKVEQAFAAVQREIDRLVSILSDYEPTSELNRLHRAASTATVVSSDLFQVLQASEAWYCRTGGAFDAAIGRLTRLWRDARKGRELPHSAAIDEALRHSGWHRIQLDATGRTLMLLDPEVRIDLGGIAAGYIVDRAFDILMAHGLSQALVNDGGDIRCGDAPPGREGWRVEVAAMRTPRSQTSPLRRILLKNAAITTSGDLWQYIEIEGQRRSHILDPETGYGVLGPSSVTIIAPTCIDADAAATAVSVLGAERGMALMSELPKFEALFVSRPSPMCPLVYSVTPGFPVGIFDAQAIDSR